MNHRAFDLRPLLPVQNWNWCHGVTMGVAVYVHLCRNGLRAGIACTVSPARVPSGNDVADPIVDTVPEDAMCS